MENRYFRFFQIGLERNEKCLYIYDSHSFNGVRKALREGGIDSTTLGSSGRINLIHGCNVYLESGIFSPDKMIDFLKAQTERAVREGYTALRVTGESSWVLQGLQGAETILEYESKLNSDFLPNYPCLGVCQYDSLRIAPDFIGELILCHPVLIRGSQVYNNFFYNPPDNSSGKNNVEKDTGCWFRYIERDQIREREFRDKTQRLHFLFSEALNPIAVIDEDGHLLDANKAALDFIDCCPEELSKKTFWDYLDNKESDREKFKNLLQTGSKNTEVRFSINGRNKSLLVNSVPLDIDERKIIYVIGQDITEHRREADALRRNELKFRSFFEQSCDGIILTDERGIILGWNRASESITGISQSDAVGKPLWEVHYEMIPDEEKNKGRRSGIKSKIESLLNPRQFPHLNIIKEMEIQRPDGARRNVETVIFLMEMEDETIFCSTLRDITDSKQAKKDLELLYKTEKAGRSELEEEARLRGQFIEVLAHELRTPLTPITVSGPMLQELLSAQSDEMPKKLIANINNSAQTLASRLSELLDLGKYSSTDFEIQKQAVDMLDFIHDFASRFHPALESRNQQLVLEVSEKLPEVEIDLSGLRKVLNNLLSIASKLTPGGRKVHLSVCVSSENLLIMVKDDGKGLSPEEQTRLFQPYHRTEQDRQRFPGMGLELAVSKQIVKAHNGNIWIESGEGRGNTFNITIPAAISR
jgi:PAS domain S-box-containing protein